MSWHLFFLIFRCLSLYAGIVASVCSHAPPSAPLRYDESYAAEATALGNALATLRSASADFERGRGLGPAGLAPLRGMSYGLGEFKRVLFQTLGVALSTGEVPDSFYYRSTSANVRGLLCCAGASTALPCCSPRCLEANRSHVPHSPHAHYPCPFRRATRTGRGRGKSHRALQPRLEERRLEVRRHHGCVLPRSHQLLRLPGLFL